MSDETETGSSIEIRNEKIENLHPYYSQKKFARVNRTSCERPFKIVCTPSCLAKEHTVAWEINVTS